MKGKEKEQLYQKRNYDHYRFSMKELLNREKLVRAGVTI